MSHLIKNLDYRYFVPLMARLPRPAAALLAQGRGSLTYLWRKEARRRGIENVGSVLPDLPPRRLRRLVRQGFESISRDEMETYWLGESLEKIRELLEFEGLERLRRAVESDRGVFFYTGHVGSYALLLAALGKMGIHLNLVFRPLKDVPGMAPGWYEYGEYRIGLLRKALGHSVLYTGGTNYFRMRQCLRRGQTLMMALDVPPEFVRRPVVVRFFGRDAVFPEGLARLCLDTKPIVLLWTVHRLGLNRNRVIIEEKTEEVLGAGSRKEATQAMVSALEERIRRYPGDWVQWEALHRYFDVSSVPSRAGA